MNIYRVNLIKKTTKYLLFSKHVATWISTVTCLFLCLVSSVKMRGDLIVLLILAELMTVSENINNINECEKNQQKTRGLF